MRRGEALCIRHRLVRAALSPSIHRRPFDGIALLFSVVVEPNTLATRGAQVPAFDNPGYLNQSRGLRSWDPAVRHWPAWISEEVRDVRVAAAPR
jgi:hypothetical protein